MSGWTSKTKTLVAGMASRVPILQAAIDQIGRCGSPIFAFHRVLPEAADHYHRGMVTTSEVFAAFLDWLSDRYQVIPLADLARLHQQHGKGGKPYCALTFDDGWRDNFLHAFPLLQERSLSATVFLAVRFIGTNRRLWQERLWFGLRSFGSPGELRGTVDKVASSLPWCRRIGADSLTFSALRRLLLERPSTEAEEFVDRLGEVVPPFGDVKTPAFLSWEEVQQMQRGGVTFGSHTLNHTLLSRADPASAWQEIEGSRRELAERLGSAPESIAYPWGALGPYTLGQVRAAGYEVGTTTAARLVNGHADRLLLPRLLISDSALCGNGQDFHVGTSSLFMARSALGLANGDGRPLRKIRHPGDRIKIGFVIDAIDFWEDGGTERQIAKLLDTLDRRYFDPELFFLRPSLRLKPEDFPCRVNLAGSWPSVKWYRPRILWNLVRLFQDRRPHIVQTFFRDATYCGVVAARIYGLAVTVVSMRNAGLWKRKRDRLPLMVIRRMVDHWQCNSRSVADSLVSEEHIPPELIEVLPNAIDLSRFKPASPEERRSVRKQLGLPPEAPVFVSVANLRPVKDIPTLMRAAHRLRKEFPSVTVLLVGDGPLSESLQAEVAGLGLAENVRFLGTEADVRPYLAAADMGVLSSRSEASSNSVLEYMAMGLPVILSDIPGNRVLVDRVFFKPGDVASLAWQMAAVWGDQGLRQTLGAENLNRVAQYNDERFAKRAQAYYARLVAESVGPRRSKEFPQQGERLD